LVETVLVWEEGFDALDVSKNNFVDINKRVSRNDLHKILDA